MQSEKPAAGLLSGSHFHIAGATWGLDMHAEADVPCTIKREKERKKETPMWLEKKNIFHARKKNAYYQKTYVINLKIVNQKPEMPSW